MINKTKVYVCAVDAMYEIGSAMGGNKVFPSIEDCKEHSPCVHECGIVEAEISFVKWIQPSNYSSLSSENNKDFTQLEHLKLVKEYHETMLNNLNNRIKELKNV